MSFRVLFNLILTGCFGLFWVGSTLYFGHELAYLSNDAVSAEAKLHMQASLAIREYTQEHVKPYFDAHVQQGFEDISVPAFASKQTLDLLYRNYPGYHYREAVLNPTNPKDLAVAWEQKLIARYRQSPGNDEQVEVLASEDGRALHAVRPIRITLAACLQCHGQPQDAPAALRQRFPAMGGFGWRLGEVIGAQIVTVPKQDHVARFQAVHDSFNLAFLLIFGSLFVVLNGLLDHFILKPLQLNNRTLSSIAETDALTMLPNRRAFDRRLALAIERTRINALPLSIMLLDIDHFKHINDEFGHAAGDETLRHFAQELAKKFRVADTFARLGGEEFIALLPGMALQDAAQRAQMLCDICASLDFNMGRAVTVSIGVAQWDGTESAAQLIARCDRCLYDAKNGGRNRVVSVSRVE